MEKCCGIGQVTKGVYRGGFCVVVALFLVASFFAGPRSAEEMAGIGHLRLGPLAFSRPLVLSGDSPHYLVAVHSLLEDGDFDLKNNYDQALAGDWDMGARFRGVEVDRHVDVDQAGRHIGTHSPFFALLIAFLTFPFGGSAWTASVAIWWTLVAGLGSIWLFGRWVARDDPGSAGWAVLVLGTATPLLCYSRDIWTEPWILLCWLGMLLSSRRWMQGVLALAGTLLKYPFAVVPFTMGLIALYRRDYRRAVWLLGSSILGLSAALGTVQWLFRDVDHFSLFHSGVHESFGVPISGLAGLFFHPENGFLFFFPLLVIGILMWRRGWAELLPVLAFVLVHASYSDWAGGTGFSARYLVPALPFFVVPLVKEFAGGKPRLYLVGLGIYSAFWGLFGGFFPAIVYDRTPWQVVEHVWVKIVAG